MKKFINKLELFLTRRSMYILAILIFLVVIAGIFYSFHLGNKLSYQDEHAYYNSAKNLAVKHQFSYDGENPSVFRPPGYSFFLAPFIFVGAKIVYLRILNFIALGFCIYFVFRLIKEKSSPLGGLIGAFFVVCYPVLFYTAGTLYPQIFGSCIFLLIFVLLTKKKKSYPLFIITGLLFGYLVLIIPAFIICLFIICIWLWLFDKSTNLKYVVVMVAFAFLPVATWSARNCIVFKSFLFVSSNSGFMLLLGNSENATIYSGPSTDITKYKNEAMQMNLNTLKADSFYRKKAVEWILNHKAEAAKLYLMKFLNSFNYRNRISTVSEVSKTKDIIMLITYGPLLVLFLFRLLLIKHFRPGSLEVLFICLYFASAMFYAIFFTRIRYRLPFDFLVIVVDALFIAQLIHTYNSKKIDNFNLVE